MSGYRVKAIDEMETTNGEIVKKAGAELGVEAFGLQVFDFPADFDGYPEHDHGEDGEEEIYVVLAGSAEFEVEGERVPLEPGLMIRIEPAATRKLWPGPDGVRVLAIGATPGKAYERPAALELRGDSPA